MDENDRIACGIEKKVSVRGGAPSGVLNVASGERLIYSTKAIIIAARREVDANRLKRGPLFILFFFLFFPPFLTFQFPLTLSSFSLFQFSLFFPPFSRPYSHCPFFQMIKPNWGKKNK
jgi:hypothetical protein